MIERTPEELNELAAEHNENADAYKKAGNADAEATHRLIAADYRRRAKKVRQTAIDAQDKGR